MWKVWWWYVSSSLSIYVVTTDARPVTGNIGAKKKWVNIKQAQKKLNTEILPIDKT
jgi:hypothetical protein